jgi:predicted DNA binding CopG/RHH family protein
MKEKKETWVRINTRIPRKDFEWIKARAKKFKMGDGALHRQIITEYIILNP